LSESASSGLLNTGNTLDESDIGISEDLLANSAHLRRAAPLKLGISNDEAECSEQMSVMVEKIFLMIPIYIYTKQF
jgi:hypothetical protein